MRAATFHSRSSRSQRVRRSTARWRRARRQRRLPTFGPAEPNGLGDGFGGSWCDQPIGYGTRTGNTPSNTAFVEFPPLVSLAGPGLTECTIEVERTSGLRLRVRLQGPSVAEILALSHWFWSAGR